MRSWRRGSGGGRARRGWRSGRGSCWRRRRGHDIVKINNYCVASVTAEQQAHFRTVRDRFVNTEAPPVSTFIYVSRLVRPGWLFEVDAMAVIDA